MTGFDKVTFGMTETVTVCGDPEQVPEDELGVTVYVTFWTALVEFVKISEMVLLVTPTVDSPVTCVLFVVTHV